MPSQDSVYDHSKGRPITSEDPGIRYDYMGPFKDTQEALLTRAVRSVTLPKEMVQDIVRPPLPQIQLFPARYGFTEDEISVEDIIDMPRRGQQRVESDFSQTPNTTQSTSRNTLGNV
jgi:hypothetical protein